MKYIIGIIAAVFLFFVVGLSSCSSVNPGHVGIKVDRWGSGAGVEKNALPMGVYFVPPGQSIYEYPVYTSTYTWTANKDESGAKNEAFAFQDKNGLGLGANIAVSYHVDPTKAPILYQKYRTDMDGIVAGPLRNVVRNSLVERASNMGVEEIYGSGKAKLAQEILADTQKYFAPFGLTVEQVYWAGNIEVPQAVLNQINAKIANEQAALAAQASVAKAKADAESRVAKAEGDAKAIQVEAEAIRTNPEIVHLRAVEKWNGQLPTYVGGNGPLPFLETK